MKDTFIFKDSKGRILRPEDIHDLKKNSLVRVYATDKKKPERIGIYSRSELIKKFW